MELEWFHSKYVAKNFLRILVHLYIIILKEYEYGELDSGFFFYHDCKNMKQYLTLTKL